VWKFFKGIPLLNVLAADAPNRDDLIDIFNLLLLVNALLFTIAGALPMSVTQDEMDIIDVNYSPVGKNNGTVHGV
jgi:hypothetical protein